MTGMAAGTAMVAVTVVGAGPGLAGLDDTEVVSVADGASGEIGNASDRGKDISADGRYVVFDSSSTNLGAGVTDGTEQVYVRDRVARTTTLVSRASVGAAPGDRDSFSPAVSADGRFVVFLSDATNLHPDDADDLTDVFVRDLVSGSTELVSRAAGPDGVKSNGESSMAKVSANGRVVAFVSRGTTLHPDDDDGDADVFVRDLVAESTSWSVVGLVRLGRLPTLTLIGRTCPVMDDSWYSSLRPPTCTPTTPTSSRTSTCATWSPRSSLS
jgi:Tol biopolymer transport system component